MSQKARWTAIEEDTMSQCSTPLSTYRGEHTTHTHTHACTLIYAHNDENEILFKKI